jgi:hypothetical protein
MLSDKIKNIIKDTIEFVNSRTNDWFIIKTLIVNQTPPKERSNFSRRHYSTKKHIINSFDREVITYWKEQTGVSLWIDPNKLHPEDWTRHRRGWGLKKYNAERQKTAKILNRKNRKRRDRKTA